MDISLNKIQQNMGKEARLFLKKECPVDYVQDVVTGKQGMSEKLWNGMVAMDWPAICIPEAYGGMGMAQTDINIILEEMGRAVVPGPFFSTVMLGAEAIIAAGTKSQKQQYLPKIAEGKIKGTLALHEPGSGADLDYIHMKAEETAAGVLLNGIKTTVSDADTADFTVCAVRTSTDTLKLGITLVIVDMKLPGITVESLPTMDGTRRLGTIVFDNVVIPADSILGQVDQGREVLDTILQRAQVGLAAECVGGAQKVMELAVDYAKTRVQYDQPIGAFQAIKHKCVDMYTDVESSRSILYWAAWAQDSGDEKTAAVAASAAKSYCTEAFTRVAGRGIQVFGGTGFTLENEMHLYLKRAKWNEVALGDPMYHREKVLNLVS